MSQRVGWTVAALLAAVVVIVWAAPGRGPLSAWGYGAAYCGFGVVLLGAVARWWRRGSPVLWRPVMLSVGALCAVIEIRLHGQSALSGTAVDRWMVALLGLLVAAIAARFMPIRLARFWYGVDRRTHEPGA